MFGCSIDELPGCDGTGVSGEICKEYQYVYGEYNGLNNYMYNADGDQLLVKVTQSKSGSEEGSTYYSYDAKDRVSKIELRNSGGVMIQSKTYHYNSNDQLSSEVVEGDDPSSILYIYNNGLLIAKTYAKDAVYQIDSLEYYSGTTDLYRTLKYAQGSVFEIEYNEWFGESINRKTCFDQMGEKLGSTVDRFDATNNLIEEIEYTSNDNVKVQTSYNYVQNVLHEVIKTDADQVVFEQLVYQRF